MVNRRQWGIASAGVLLGAGPAAVWPQSAPARVPAAPPTKLVDTRIVIALDNRISLGYLPLTIAAAALLAIAALLKSAQFPTHGWLTEVMETPTPVSALLHAGVVNAGGFLLIRFADVMLQAPVVLAVLVMVGGFTALFGSLVMLTQSAVKTSLAWSTVAQMGFMILQCGLALFPIALLHIVAHSLYKAHAFLASGSAIADASMQARMLGALLHRADQAMYMAKQRGRNRVEMSGPAAATAAPAVVATAA